MSNRGSRAPQQQYVRGAGGAPVPVLVQQGGVPVPMRGPFPPPGTQILVQAGPPPPSGAYPAVAQMEHKLHVQHAEFQQLLTENQRLAATHVALRQELAAAQGEIQRLKQGLADKDVGLRQLMEKSAKLEADLRATDTTRHELQAARQELQAMVARRQELEAARAAQATQMQQMQADMQRMRGDLQQFSAMRQDMEGLQQELQRARQALEFEKKSNVDLVEQRTAMEKNLVSMARDVERLKAELANVPKQPAAQQAPAAGYGGYGAAAYGVYGATYGDGYSGGAPQAYAPTYGYAHAQAPVPGGPHAAFTYTLPTGAAAATAGQQSPPAKGGYRPK